MGDQQMTEPNPEPSFVDGEIINELSVQRDNRFIQFYADHALSVRAPKSLEVSFLKIESRIRSCRFDDPESELPDAFKIAPSVREVARATLPITVAVNLALDILDEVAPTGLFKMNDLKERLDAIVIASAAAKDSEEN